MDLKLAADTHRGADPDILTTSELYGKVDGLFASVGVPGFKRLEVGDNSLDDAGRLQTEIMDASDRGVIDATDAKTMVKTIQLKMDEFAGQKKQNLEDQGHYGKAYKEFVKSGATPTEVNRMFREYVKASDDNKFDEQEAQKGPVWAQAWDSLFGGKKEQSGPQAMTPDRAVQAIVTAQAQQRYRGLVMLPSTPNAVIGRDGSSMAMNTQPPQGSADVTIERTDGGTLSVIDGENWMVFPDGTGYKI